MCGITGVVYHSHESVKLDILEKMTKTLSHRGPDGSGVKVFENFGFGHQRLSILDLSSHGEQPMVSENQKIYLTYNGEIYNFKILQKTLSDLGYKFKSQSDTEVLLHAFEEWGIESVSKFNGMFAYAFWDTRTQALHLVRDRLGIKPLFYYEFDGGIIFGSEIKAILEHPKVKREIDLVSLDEYLSLNYCQAPRTLFKGLYQLLPGERIEYIKGKISKIKYWDVPYNSKKIDKGEENNTKKLDQLFKECVARTMVSDVPVGCFLSGGVDSSATSVYMAALSPNPIKTFSIGFEEATFNELEYARIVSKSIKSQHYEEIITAKASSIIEKIVEHSEEPTADSSMIPLYYLSKLAREHVTVALSGDGADEIFAGYETHTAFFASQLYSKLPNFLSKNIIPDLINKMPVSEKKLSLEQKLKRFVGGANLSPEEAHFSWRLIFNNELKSKIYSDSFKVSIQNQETNKSYKEEFDKMSENTWLDKILYADTVKYLPNDMLTKVDRMSMAHSLEVRVPFLDHELVEFAAALPDKYKLRNFTQKKYLLKKLLHGKVPPIIWERKKAGFNVPLAKWFREDLKDFTQSKLINAPLMESGLFNKNEILKIFELHLNHQNDYSYELWGLLTLSIWYTKFIKVTE